MTAQRASTYPALTVGIARKAEPPATPLIKRIAAEHSIDLRQLAGSGPRGRVTRKDLELFVAELSPQIDPRPDSSAAVSETGRP